MFLVSLITLFLWFIGSQTEVEVNYHRFINPFMRYKHKTPARETMQCTHCTVINGNHNQIVKTRQQIQNPNAPYNVELRRKNARTIGGRLRIIGNVYYLE